MTPPHRAYAPGRSSIGRPLPSAWVALWALVWMVAIILSPDSLGQAGQTPGLETALERVRQHSFHPIREGFTFDRNLKTHGVASLDDLDWKVRLLALRDLVRAGTAGMDGMLKGLDDGNPHVRQVSAMALGILSVTNSIPALHRLLIQDPDEVVRSQAAVSLGQIAHASSLEALRVAQTNDPSRDVQHQAELAAYAVQHGKGVTPALAKAFAGMEEGPFRPGNRRAACAGR